MNCTRLDRLVRGSLKACTAMRASARLRSVMSNRVPSTAGRPSISVAVAWASTSIRSPFPRTAVKVKGTVCGSSSSRFRTPSRVPGWFSSATRSRTDSRASSCSAE